MDGKILNIAQGGKIIITSFTAVGCGDGIDLANTVTDRIAILMTGGGGKDQSISVEEVEVYGR